MASRTFESGATRNSDTDKLDYEGFFSPLVLQRRAEYMNKNRTQEDGSVRASDNWQLGIPIPQYMKSMFRHFHEVWSIYRGWLDGDLTEALCALMFNAEGMLHERLKMELDWTDQTLALVKRWEDEGAERVAFDRWADSTPEAWDGIPSERDSETNDRGSATRSWETAVDRKDAGDQ